MRCLLVLVAARLANGSAAGPAGPADAPAPVADYHQHQAFRRLPLTADEFRRIAGNEVPYLR